jgi:putative aldouronate transport system substrate-binding protein
LIIFIFNKEESVKKSNFILFGLIIGFLFGINIMVSAQAGYPLKKNVTIEYWMPLHANVASIVKNFGDTEFSKELQKRVGVTIHYLHPSTGNPNEAFNLMLASGDLPDIIEYNWLNIPGGPNEALTNKYIVRLNPYIDKYAPNFKKYMKAHPEIDRIIKTDDGSYYVFPFVRGDAIDPTLIVTSGPIVRKDWLDDLGLKIPETLDEWYTVLKAFKEKKNADIPLTVEFQYISQMFASGTDNTDGFYVENGKVKFGQLDPNRKIFIATLNKWYKEGLLDSNFPTNVRKNTDANMLSGKSGATYGSGGSGIGIYMQSMKTKDPKFNVTGAPFPTSKKGKNAKFGFATPAYGNPYGVVSTTIQGNAAISTKCKDIEAAVRLLDYAYTDEGYMLYNFGIKGVSYNLVKGKPAYTELILHNPDNVPVTSMMSKYMRSNTSGPFIQDKGYLEQYYELPQQKEAMKIWAKNDYLKYMMPPVTPTAAESDELSNILTDIITYRDEMTTKFILGTEPLDNYDKYIAQIKSLGAEKAVAIFQASYDRFMKRK